MTAHRFVTISCDVCGEVSDGGMDNSVKEARASARGDGWQYAGRQDVCPRHHGFYWSEVAGWVYDPDIAADQEARCGR